MALATASCATTLADGTRPNTLSPAPTAHTRRRPWSPAASRGAHDGAQRRRTHADIQGPAPRTSVCPVTESRHSTQSQNTRTQHADGHTHTQGHTHTHLVGQHEASEQ
jgi:hypothetical protein